MSPTSTMTMTSVCSEKLLIKLLNGPFSKEQNSKTYCLRPYHSRQWSINQQSAVFQSTNPLLAFCVFLHFIHKDMVTGLWSCWAVTILSIVRISSVALIDTRDISCPPALCVFFPKLCIHLVKRKIFQNAHKLPC